MRFLHISDLHIGKRIYGIDLWEDQAHILDQICGMAQEEACDAVLIAGDLYDRAQPSAQAIAMVDGFLSRLSQMGIPVYLVSGNHDNPAQIAYCAGILARGGIYAARVFDGSLQRFCLRDAYGLVNLYALPFVRPSQVRRFFPEAEIKSFEQAVRCILEAADIPAGERNVLIAHQYVAGARTCESEELSIGGTEQIPAELFEPFSYTALGHLHSPQALLGGRVRYSGSILKYSFDERRQQKGALLVDLGPRGELVVAERPFAPLRDLREVQGTLAELAAQPYSEDYIQAVIEDPVMPLDAQGTLRINFPNLLYLKLASAQGVPAEGEEAAAFSEAKGPIEHFREFYRAQNPGQDWTEQKQALAMQALREAEETACGQSL